MARNSETKANAMIVLTEGYNLARRKVSEVAGGILPEHEWTWEATFNKPQVNPPLPATLQCRSWSDCSQLYLASRNESGGDLRDGSKRRTWQLIRGERFSRAGIQDARLEIICSPGNNMYAWKQDVRQEVRYIPRRCTPIKVHACKVYAVRYTSLRYTPKDEVSVR